MASAVKISPPIWNLGTTKLCEATAAEHTKRKENASMWSLSPEGGLRDKGVLVRHFSYDLHRKKFTHCQLERVSSLFFEFAAAQGENVTLDYVILQMNEPEQDGGTQHGYQYQIDLHREQVLRFGICGADGVDPPYTLFGCSNSQVQQHSFVMRKGSLAANEEHLLKILPKLRDLEQKKGPAKRVKYAGLMFSGVTTVNLPSDVHITEIKTFKNDSAFDFTDGVGTISCKLARVLQHELGLRECPSVFQIRYCGVVHRLDASQRGYVCKGVLLVDPKQEETHSIQVRSSMLKAETSPAACKILQGKLGIVDHSQKPSVGRLGQQLLCLLSGRVPSETLLKVQQQHLEFLRTSWHDPLAMAWLAVLDPRPSAWRCFSRLLRQHALGPSAASDDTARARTAYYACTAGSLSRHCSPAKKKVQLPLAASRTLFGVVWPEGLHDELEEHQCVVLLEKGPLRPGHALVSRSPSYHPGDVRVLQVRALPDGHPALKLRNCILFSTKGLRPEPDKMGGGDLDGDKYLVVWHPELLECVPALMHTEPASYDVATAGVASKSEQSERGKLDWISYAATFDNGMLGEVESTFYRVVKLFGVTSPEVERLNSLFASLVDRNPVSVDEFHRLKRRVAAAAPADGAEPSVWERMAQEQHRFAEECFNRGSPGPDDFLKFQQALSRCAAAARGLPQLLLRHHASHFLNSVWAAEVQGTMAEWECRWSVMKERESKEQLALSFADCSSGDQESNLEQRQAFAALEQRAHMIFEQPLAAFDKERIAALGTIDQQHCRRRKLCLKLDKQVLELEREMLKLDDEISRIESLVELEPLRLQSKQRTESWKQELDESLSVCRKRMELLLGMLSGAEDQLQKAQGELNKHWWHWSLVSSTKCDLMQRVQEIQVQCARLQEDADLEASRIKQKEDEHQQKMDAHLQEMSYATEEHLALAKLKRLHHSSLSEKASSFRQKQADILSGKEAERLRCCRDELAQKCFEDEGFDAAKQEREACATELDALTQELEAMFFPEAVQQAEEDLCALSDMEESMELGLCHILHKLQVAKELCTDQAARVEGERCESDCRLRTALADLGRVCDLEENRLRGFLSQSGQRAARLPVYQKRAQLQRCLAAAPHCAVVVTAGTGSGKSTQLPQYIADDFYSFSLLSRAPAATRSSVARRGPSVANEAAVAGTMSRPARICCTQPRRVAAQRVAERVAREYGTEVGQLVGYRVGSRGRPQSEDCRRVSKATVIEFVTEGLLLRDVAQGAEFIQRYDCIIVDEAHERNKETDLLLALLGEHLRKCRATVGMPAFKLVVMSASIDATRFCQFLDGCPTVDCPGKLFHVEEVHASDSKAGDSVVTSAVQVLFDKIVGSEHAGDVLIFLSGAKQIEECVEAIRSCAVAQGISSIVVYPFYAELDQESKAAATDQHHRAGVGDSANKNASNRKRMRVSGPKKKNSAKAESECAEAEVRKVICCTNIAETSLTIEGVRFVIDSGLVKKVVYDHSLRCGELREERVSMASAQQRRGRAGRTQSGWCYRLYSQATALALAEFDTPAIKQTPLEELVLFSLHVCGRSIEDFGLLDSPDAMDIRAAKERLLDWAFVAEFANKNSADGLGTIVGNIPTPAIQLTEHGRLACALDWLKPESVRMLLAACSSYPRCLHRAIKLAVLMSTDKELTRGGRSPDTSVGINAQSVSGCHVLGDHFLALEQFEWFEMLKQKQPKNANANALKDRCGVHGLDVDVLCSVQDGVERCHLALKQRGLLPTQMATANVAEAAMGEDECLLRVLIAGWFHCVVASIDGQNQTLGFVPLEPTKHRRFELDRASCLQRKEEEEEEEDTLSTCISESDKDEQCDGGSFERDDERPHTEAQLREQQHVTAHSFLVYGKLQCVQTSIGSRVFMKHASMVQGAWIEAEAPGRWLQRVKFDPKEPRLGGCKEIIKHVGPKILSSIDRFAEETPGDSTEGFFKLVERTSEANLVLAQKAQSQVFIFGTQSAVGLAKDKILERIAQSQQWYRECDSGKTMCGNVLFESGMQVVDVKEKGKPGRSGPSWLSTVQTHFRAEGHNQTRGSSQLRGDNVSIFSRTSAGVTAVRPNYTWSLQLVEQCLLELQLKHALAVKKSGYEMHVSTTDKPGNLVAKLKPEPVFASIVVDRDFVEQTAVKLTCSIPSWVDWWTALCHEAHQERPFWKVFYGSVCSNKRARADLRFVRSMRRFEVFGLGRDALAQRFLRKFEELCISGQRCAAIEGLHRWDARWKLRRFASVLEDVRKEFPCVLVIVEVSFRASRGTAREWERGDSWDGECSDYGWLSRACADASGATEDEERWRWRTSEDGEDQAAGVRVRLAAAESGQGSMLAAARTRVLSALFPHAGSTDVGLTPASASPTRSGEKQARSRSRCVMCRRGVVIQLGGKDGGGGSSLGQGETPGWRLSLCGCTYCRECFRDAATEGLTDGWCQAVQCQKCNTAVLAQDCRDILKPKLDASCRGECVTAQGTTAHSLRDQHEAEWRQVCLLAEASWCRANVPPTQARKRSYEQRPANQDESSGWFQCPDCCWAMVYHLLPPRNRFFGCRNPRCPNMVCAACLRVVASDEDARRCREGECARERAGAHLESEHEHRE